MHVVAPPPTANPWELTLSRATPPDWPSAVTGRMSAITTSKPKPGEIRPQRRALNARLSSRAKYVIRGLIPLSERTWPVSACSRATTLPMISSIRIAPSVSMPASPRLTK